MSRFWPHPAYAEDQPWSRSILYTHCLTRGIQAGALVGAGSCANLILLRRFNVLKSSAIHPPWTSIIRSSGVGAVVGFSLMAVAVPGRMWAREAIEWQDRSWRLLENKGQVECDDWTYGAMAGAAASTAIATARHTPLGWRGATGYIGIGSLAGMMGYMGWRYGVKGGEFEEEQL